MIGARVVKTAVAVTISILIAESLDLYTFQFAGIIAVLSVQPSIYRSLRSALQMMASAVVAALLGAAALFSLGGTFYAMGLVAFILMILHVKIRWTNSLLVSVVVGINTMGTIGLDFKEAALNQIALVLIGTVTGTLVNMIRKPVHQERAEVVLTQSEGMLRVLLNLIVLDLENGRMTPYPLIKDQVAEIGAYLRRGKEIAGFVMEDRKLRIIPAMDTAKIFGSFQTMLDKIHDIAKALANAEPDRAEMAFLKKALNLVSRMQENVILGKRINPGGFDRVLARKREQMWKSLNGTEEAAVFLAYYNAYGCLRQYLGELSLFLVERTGLVKRRLTYTSIDRPGLLAEVSGVLQRHDLNITDVAMRVNGDFAKTAIEISCRIDVKSEEVVDEILKVKSVLNVEFG